MNDPPTDEVRDTRQIARRALSLFGVVGLSLGAPRDEILGWLKDEDLWDELSPLELAYVLAAEPTEQQTFNATWWSEGLVVLLWSLRKIKNLPQPNEQCDTAQFQELMPPFADMSAEEFVTSAERRPEDVLHEMADELMHFHWQARDAQLHSKPIPPHLDIEIIEERHRAINWVIGYGGLPWDDVATDT